MNALIKKIVESRRVRTKLVALLNFIERERSNEKKERLISKLRAFGKYSQINGDITIKWPWGVAIGNNVHIGNNSFLDGRGGVIIGDNTYISRNLVLHTTNHHYRGDQLPFNQKYQAREVIIGKNVWIGMNVCITPGVQIGDGAIIGMGSVISKDISAGDIVVSNRQMIIGHRGEEDYLQKEKAGSYGGISGKPIKTRGDSRFLVTPFDVKKVVFVLSTGRAGSNSMAKMFNNFPSVSAFHETFYTLLKRLSIEYLTGRIGREDAKEKIYFYFSKIAFIKSDTIYVESDQKLVPFIDILNELFDSPKFIWIIRHPKTFMHSAVSRGWFADDDPQFFENKVLIDPNYTSHGTRIAGYLTGEYSEEEWKRLDKRIKALWYWKYWNKLIEKGLESMPSQQQLFLKLEELDNQKEEIIHFLDLEGTRTLTINKSNTVKKKDAGTYDQTKEANYKFFDEEGIKMVEKAMNLFGYMNKK